MFLHPHVVREFFGVFMMSPTPPLFHEIMSRRKLYERNEVCTFNINMLSSIMMEKNKKKKEKNCGWELLEASIIAQYFIVPLILLKHIYSCANDYHFSFSYDDNMQSAFLS